MIGLRFSNVIDPSEYADFPSFENDPASRKWNLWSCIDARDGAQAVVRALECDKPGFDMSRSSKELMAEFFPETELRAPTDGTQSLCWIEGSPSSWLGATALMARPRVGVILMGETRRGRAWIDRTADVARCPSPTITTSNARWPRAPGTSTSTPTPTLPCT